MTYPHPLPVPPNWEKLNGEQRQAIRPYLQENFKDAGNNLHRYRAYQDEIRQHNEQIESGDVENDSDEKLGAKLQSAVDLFEEATPRLATALARRREGKSSVSYRHAKENIERALRILSEDVDALVNSPEARAHRNAEAEIERVWKEAKRLYEDHARRTSGEPRPKPLPFDMLSTTQREDWFVLADDRVPPKWGYLSDAQRRTWAQLNDGDPRRGQKEHARVRARNLRRRAYRQIEHAKPFTILSPQQRMIDVAETAQVLSWAKAENAAGRMNDLQLAAWEEHHSRALHAYTRPAEPYPKAP